MLIKSFQHLTDLTNCISDTAESFKNIVLSKNETLSTQDEFMLNSYNITYSKMLTDYETILTSDDYTFEEKYNIFKEWSDVLEYYNNYFKNPK